MKKKYLALDYHKNSQNLDTISYFDKRMQYKIYPSAKSINLENYCGDIEFKEREFIKILLSRKSVRTWTDDGINLEKLSKLLRYSFGMRSNDFKNMGFRTYASAGGRYPIEVYVLILNSDDIEKGIYHYNVYNNSLEFIKKGDFRKEIYKLYNNQPFDINCSFVLFFSMVFERTMEKYGDRGYRFILLDAGHMSQNLYLVSEFLGLGIVEIGASKVSDEMIDKLIGLDSDIENIFLAFFLGKVENT